MNEAVESRLPAEPETQDVDEQKEPVRELTPQEKNDIHAYALNAFVRVMDKPSSYWVAHMELKDPEPGDKEPVLRVHCYRTAFDEKAHENFQKACTVAAQMARCTLVVVMYGPDSEDVVYNSEGEEQ